MFEVPAGHAAEEIVPRQERTVFERRACGNVQFLDAKRGLRRQTLAVDLKENAIFLQQRVNTVEYAYVGAPAT